MFDLSLLGRLSFAHVEPAKRPLPPGYHRLGIADERDAVIFVPCGLAEGAAVPLLVMFHGAGGFPDKVLPFFEALAEQRKFIVLAPHSLYPTWDLVIGGHGPDLERLQGALAEVASRYRIDRNHFAFAGFSDGASYALSVGIANGDFVSHVVALSAGFVSTLTQAGAPKLFIAHGLVDEQLPIDKGGRAHATRLETAGYDVRYVEFNGTHAIYPSVVNMAIQFFLG